MDAKVLNYTSVIFDEYDVNIIQNMLRNNTITMDNTIEIKNKIRKFIIETTYVSEDKINNDTLIFAQGIFDSMGFISLISYVEETFAFKAKDTELLEVNFESINAIASYVERKLN